MTTDADGNPRFKVAAKPAATVPDPRASHNAPKGRFGYRPKRIFVTGAEYEIELDHRGRAYAWQGGTMRRCDVLPTKIGWAVSGPDEREFQIVRKDGRWYFRDLSNGVSTSL